MTTVTQILEFMASVQNNVPVLITLIALVSLAVVSFALYVVLKLARHP